MRKRGGESGAQERLQKHFPAKFIKMKDSIVEPVVSHQPVPGPRRLREDAEQGTRQYARGEARFSTFRLSQKHGFRHFVLFWLLFAITAVSLFSIIIQIKHCI